MEHESEIFRIWECSQPECRFRFSALLTEKTPPNCPRCHSDLKLVLNDCLSPKVTTAPQENPSPQLTVLLDGLRSTFNVGAVFRTGDGAGVKEILLCGTTPTPEHPKMIKTGLGAQWSVPWRYNPNALLAAQECREKGATLIALEGGETACSLFDLPVYPPEDKLVLIAGNEATGVDPELLGMCDHIAYIPMQGYKRSLNVSIALGLGIYALRFNIRTLQNR
ncbi:MAG TPA: RNA methyltransferase [Longilinea sp.]|nr:RNA methyltransferase [Longilinea sp.]